MKPNELKSNQKVEVKLARGFIFDETLGCHRPNWKDWQPATLYVCRREKALPKSSKSKCGNVGDVISLCINEIPWAEYSQDDYNESSDTYSCEDYLMQIRKMDN